MATPQKSFRLSDRALADLAAAQAARGDASDRQTVEAAAALLARPCFPVEAAALGLDGSPGRVRQALAAAAAAVEDAARSLLFGEDEWNYLADANNGIGLLDHEGDYGPSPAAIRAHVAANAADAQTLNRLGDKWLGTGPAADERVRRVVNVVAGCCDVEAWALYFALRWFWDHPETDTRDQPWWLPSWRAARAED